MSYLRESVLSKKTVQFLKDNAVVTKKTEEKENKED
jgi:hypothetical protein